MWRTASSSGTTTIWHLIARQHHVRLYTTTTTTTTTSSTSTFNARIRIVRFPTSNPCTCTCSCPYQPSISISASVSSTYLLPRRFMRKTREFEDLRKNAKDVPRERIAPTLDNVDESHSHAARKSQPGASQTWPSLAARNANRRHQLIPGLVIANYGDRVLVQDERTPSDPSAQRLTSTCVPRGRLMRPLCGDRVLWVPAAHMQRLGDGIVEEICTRQNELKRLDKKGHFRTRSLAANIDHVLIIMAPQPKLKPDLIDRYLGTAVTMGADVTFVYNKRDLEPIMPMLVYEFGRLGFPLLHTSTTTGEGLEELRQRMREIKTRSDRPYSTSILVGQSGTGKSSLLNALIPNFHIVTRGLSRTQTAGKHTTTSSIMHDMEPGIKIIDSPGFQNYNPVPVAPNEVILGYVEMLEHAKLCRFGTRCTHIHEPSCGIQSAVAEGVISQRRYDSYVEHFHLMREMMIQKYET